MTDEEFIALKLQYYSEADRSDLPVRASSPGTPGEANNLEQAALRWGYEAAIRDLRVSEELQTVEDVDEFVERMIHGPELEKGVQPEGFLHGREA